MLFNSIEFPVFLALVLGVFYVIPPTWWSARKLFLLVASYAFYMSWNPFFGSLLAFSTLLDFSVGRGLDRVTTPAGRRALLAMSLCGNLGLLGYFKYGNFVAQNLNDLLRPFGLGPRLADTVLPVGISFYTFQTLGYAIDVYRRRLPAERSLLNFALFVSFFPQLVAGPIVRAGAFLPQLVRRSGVDMADVELALARVAAGFFKKVVLADSLGVYVDEVFAQPGLYRGANVLLAAYGYAFQIYFDFSGYSDIAIGVARLFGFRLPENFDRPYLAASPREFWRRWHITLSTWFRDYVYVPLGGNRASQGRLAVNLMVTMTLAGLWHGAAWTFVAWGAFHGILLVGQRLLLGDREARSGLSLLLARLTTFHLVCAGWVLFRARDFPQALDIFASLASLDVSASQAAGQAIVALTAAVLLHVGPSAPALRERFVRLPTWAQGLGFATLAGLVFLFSPRTARFIYFQF